MTNNGALFRYFFAFDIWNANGILDYRCEQAHTPCSCLPSTKRKLPPSSNSSNFPLLNCCLCCCCCCSSSGLSSPSNVNDSNFSFPRLLDEDESMADWIREAFASQPSLSNFRFVFHWYMKQGRSPEQLKLNVWLCTLDLPPLPVVLVVPPIPPPLLVPPMPVLLWCMVVLAERGAMIMSGILMGRWWLLDYAAACRLETCNCNPPRGVDHDMLAAF